MSTPDRILTLALRLFNERGSHAVTTNHLAAELGISIGNLYYHFKNKEDIVLELFTRLNLAWKTRLVIDNPGRVRWPDLEGLIAEHFSLLWEYRFFYREQVTLRQRDPRLARRWAAAHRRGRADMAALLRSYLEGTSAGIAPIPEAGPETRSEPTNEVIDRLTDACWLLADYWLLYVESRRGPLRKHDLAHGVRFFTSIVAPLLADHASHAPIDLHSGTAAHAAH